MKTQQIQFSIHALWWDRTVAPSPNPSSKSEGSTAGFSAQHRRQACVTQMAMLTLTCETGWQLLTEETYLAAVDHWDEFHWGCRQLLLTLSRALGAISCCVKGLSYHVNSHGVRFWSYFFSLTLFLLHLNCSAFLVFLWVVSSNFCSLKSVQCCIWALTCIELCEVWFLLFCEHALHSSHLRQPFVANKTLLALGFDLVFTLRFFPLIVYSCPPSFFPAMQH